MELVNLKIKNNSNSELFNKLNVEIEQIKNKNLEKNE